MALHNRISLRRLRFVVRIGSLALPFVMLLAGPSSGQSQIPVTSLRTVNETVPDDVRQQLDALRTELAETRRLQERVQRLETELARKRRPDRDLHSSRSPETSDFQRLAGTDPPASAPETRPRAAPCIPPAESSFADPDRLPLLASYGYNFGGGFTQLSDADEEFTVKLQNQLTLDGTFYDQPNMPTAEKGFNIPFYRTYLYGNITQEWDYQVAVQGFLGEFNVLDAWINYTIDDALQFRAGRLLSPCLYEYWAFSPAWEPVITNSPLFQVAGKRQMGGMAWGRLAANRAQYQAGIFTGIEGGFYDLDRSVDFLGSITFTPWKGRDDRFDSLGFGASVQTGMQNYALNLANTEAFINGAGEPTLNFNYINSTGVPFFQYNDDVAADGWRTKVAPHFFWYGRFSIHAEYIWQQRALSDATSKGTTILNGYQTTLAYLLTGESRTGDGLGGWATVEPRSPFSPSKGECGPGAWELAFQYSGLDVGADNFQLGFADPATSTNRLNQSMLGLNWWPNRYTRLSFDWVNCRLNRPVPTGGQLLDEYNIYWTRAAMFF